MALRKSTRGTKKLAIMKGFPPSISCLFGNDQLPAIQFTVKRHPKTRRHSVTGTSNLMSHVNPTRHDHEHSKHEKSNEGHKTRSHSCPCESHSCSLDHPCHINSPSTAKRESVNLQTTHSTAHSPTSSRAVLELRPNTFRSAFSFCTEKVKILIHFGLIDLPWIKYILCALLLRQVQRIQIRFSCLMIATSVRSSPHRKDARWCAWRRMIACRTRTPARRL